MISVSHNNLKVVFKVVISCLILYSLFFLFTRVKIMYDNTSEFNKLTKELKKKKEENVILKNKIKINKNKIIEIKSQYLNQYELNNKITGIFKRMSSLGFNLKLFKSKKICIDRYALAVQLTAKSEKGLEGGENLLKYIGKVTKNKDIKTFYIVDYRMKKRD